MKHPPGKRRKRARPHVRSDAGYFTKAGPVTVLRTDGTSEVRPALTEEQVQRSWRIRPRISQATRVRVTRRDGACVYCGAEVGPFEIDHRVPIALGGTNRMGNLVLACVDCNRRKGSEVW